MRTLRATLAACVCALAAVGEAAAQAAGPRLDVSGAYAHARPPAGIAASAGYALIGASARLGSPLGSGASATVGVGLAPESGAARWLEGGLAGDLRARCALASCGARLEGAALHYPGDVGYSAASVRAVPEVRVPVGAAELRVTGNITRGAWQTAARQPPLGLPGGAPARSGTLATTGGVVSLGVAAGPIWLQAVAERTHSSGGALEGTYTAFGGDVALAHGRIAAAAGARAWQTPRGSETAYSLMGTLRVIDGLSMRAQIGRTATDALYGAPGALMTSIGLTWSVGGRASARDVPTVRVLSATGAHRTVRFVLRAPDAGSVGVAGDFNGWSPVPLKRHGDEWSTELQLAPGAYHFSFVVDGAQWLVPDHAPGIVDDGFGRKNATIVVE